MGLLVFGPNKTNDVSSKMNLCKSRGTLVNADGNYLTQTQFDVKKTCRVFWSQLPNSRKSDRKTIIGDGLVYQFHSSVGVLSRRSYILSGDIRIAVEWREFGEAFDIPEASSSTQFRYSLGSCSLGYLHRRNHHVQVRISLSILFFNLVELDSV